MNVDPMRSEKEHQAPRMSLPRARHGEAHAVQAALGLVRRAALIVSAEAVLFPVRRHRDGAPYAGPTSCGNREFPWQGVFRSMAGQVLTLGLGCRLNQQARKKDEGGDQGTQAP